MGGLFRSVLENLGYCELPRFTDRFNGLKAMKVGVHCGGAVAFAWAELIENMFPKI